MKISPVFLPVLVGAVLAGSAGIFAYVRNQPQPEPPVAAIAKEHTVGHDESAPPAVLTTETTAPGTPAVPRLAASSVFRSYRLTPRRAPLALSIPGPAKPSGDAADQPASLLGSNTLSRKPEQLAKMPTPGMSTSRFSSPESSPPAASVQEAIKPSAPPDTIFAFGAGIDHLPRWQGSAKSENRPIPYIDINWRDQVEFSTVKGLIIDLIHGEQWHGGIIGTLVWGRSTKDLAGLKIPTLRNTVQGGLYLEYALTPQATLGVRFRQDLQNTGVSYGELYGELELPKQGYLEHDLRLSFEGMNQAGMRRFFGLSAQDAARLGVSAYQPNAALSKISLTYEGFQPTSESTGIAFGATIGQLSSTAANSPLVRNFGSRTQKEVVVAFVYHF